MKNFQKIVTAGLLVMLLGLGASAAVQASAVNAWMNVNMALAMMDKVNALRQAMATDTAGVPVAVVPPTPIAGNSGKFMSPYASDGTVTPWASRAMQARAGAAVGGELGGRAAAALASKVPVVGGMFSGFMQKKTQESAAVIAMGGWNYIRNSTDQSFDNLDDLAVFMHVRHGGRGDYQEALAATMALYPDLENRYEAANRVALQQAGRGAHAQASIAE